MMWQLPPTVRRPNIITSSYEHPRPSAMKRKHDEDKEDAEAGGSAGQAVAYAGRPSSTQAAPSRHDYDAEMHMHRRRYEESNPYAYAASRQMAPPSYRDALPPRQAAGHMLPAPPAAGRNWQAADHSYRDALPPRQATGQPAPPAASRNWQAADHSLYHPMGNRSFQDHEPYYYPRDRYPPTHAPPPVRPARSYSEYDQRYQYHHREQYPPQRAQLPYAASYDSRDYSYRRGAPQMASTPFDPPYRNISWEDAKVTARPEREVLPLMPSASRTMDSVAAKINAQIIQEQSTADECEPSILCTCKKSRCLKLYCQCFASSAMCNALCKCNECMNTPENTMGRIAAIQQIKSRNPGAFQTKFVADGDPLANNQYLQQRLGAFNALPQSPSAEAGTNVGVHKVGCKCKKSACLKKYCECFGANAKCGPNCRCSGCKNQPEGFGPGEAMPPPPQQGENPQMSDAAHNLAFLKHSQDEDSPPRSQPIQKSVTEESLSPPRPSESDVQSPNASLPGRSRAKEADSSRADASELLLAARAMAELGGQ